MYYLLYYVIYISHLLMKGGDTIMIYQPIDDSTLSVRCTDFLDRIFRLRLFNRRSETEIIDRFLAVKTVDDLKKLCYDISHFLIEKLGYNDLFIV